MTRSNLNLKGPGGQKLTEPENYNFCYLTKDEFDIETNKMQNLLECYREKVKNLNRQSYKELLKIMSNCNLLIFTFFMVLHVDNRYIELKPDIHKCVSIVK